MFLFLKRLLLFGLGFVIGFVPVIWFVTTHAPPRGSYRGREMFLACFQMANDGEVSGGPLLGWPGELNQGAKPVRTFSELMDRLVEHDYLKPDDLQKITSYEGRPGSAKPPWSTWFKIYRVTKEDGPSTIFLASRNFTYGKDVDPSLPLGGNGFIIVRKGGDVAVYRAKQAHSLTSIGLLPGRRDFQDRPVETAEDTLESR